MGKRGRHKRLFPKNYSASFIPVSRIDHFKAAAYNSQRSKATVGSKGNTEHKIDNSFTQEVPKTITPYTKISTLKSDAQQGRHEPLMPPKGFAIQSKHELLIVEQKKKERDSVYFYRVWQDKRGQGVSEFFCQELRARANHRLMLLFSGNDYFFVQENFISNIRFVSRMYSDMSTAMAHVRTWDISWTIEEEMK